MENIKDFEIVNLENKISITYKGKNPKINKCANELDIRFGTFHLVKSLLSALAENTPTSSEQLATPAVSESLPSDDEIKLTGNEFGSLENALKEANGNVC